MDHIVEFYNNHVERSIDGDTISLEVRPDTREQFIHRREILAHYLAPFVYRPGDRGQVWLRIAYMLSVFSIGRNVGQKEADANVELFLSALDAPSYFIQQAANDFVQSRADHDPSYIPNAPQITKRARELAEPFRCELARIDRVLNAELRLPPNHHEQIVVGEHFEALAEKLKADRELSRETLIREDWGPRAVKSTDEFIRRDWHRHGEEPIKAGKFLVSPSLAANIRGHLARDDDPTERKATKRKARR
jgi:hypothetical protein